MLVSLFCWDQKSILFFYRASSTENEGQITNIKLSLNDVCR